MISRRRAAATAGFLALLALAFPAAAGTTLLSSERCEVVEAGPPGPPGDFLRVEVDGELGVYRGSGGRILLHYVGPHCPGSVADWGNQKIVEFSETGEFIRQFGSEGTGNGQFKRPDVIEVDSKGRVWVGDQNNARIQRFTETGIYMSQFGTAGSGAGQFSFGWPMGIASDGSGNLWVADTGNNRVQKWG